MNVDVLYPGVDFLVEKALVRSLTLICISALMQGFILTMQLAMTVSCLCGSNGEVFPGHDILLQVG